MSSAPVQAGLQRFAGLRELTLLLLIVVLIIVMSVLSPYFLSLANFRAIAVGLIPTAIIVVGMTMLLVSGCFDLSVGSVLALASTVFALLVTNGLAIPLAVIVTAALGLVVGFVNGLIVTAAGVNPLVATLGTMSVARGVALVLTEGFSIASLPASFGWAGKAEILGLPAMFWIMVAIVVTGDLCMRHLAFLRQAYFIGANERAARLSGMPVDRVKIVAFIVTATLASIAGMLLASRLMSGTPTAGNALELQVLAAAVIGGASLRGGEGTVFGAFLGVVFVALVNNAMTMLAVSIYWQMIVTGCVLVAAVAIDVIVKRRRD